MKVTYIHQYFRTPQMCGGTRSYEFARRLAAHGHKVEVITSDGAARPAGQPSWWRTTTDEGFTVHWVAVPYENSMGYRRRLQAFGHFALAASRKAATIESDVVIATSTPLTIAIPGVFAAWRRRVPMVLEIRDLWPATPIAVGALKSPFMRRAGWAFESWAYRHAAQIIALSPDMADDIHARFESIPITVIPNGSDLDAATTAAAAGKSLRQSMPWLEERPMILYAGAIGFVNGADYLVRLAVALRRLAPEIRVVILGDGRELERVRDLAHELRVLDDNLFLLPPVPKREALGYFGACDLAISVVRDIPELAANSANKFFDGLAAGCPVAVNHGGWIAEIIESSGAGLVLPADDHEKAARLVVEFLADAPRVANARQAADELGRHRFARDLLFDDFERVLQQAVDTGRISG